MKLRKVRFIVIHTAASGDPRRGRDWDVSAKDVERIHKKAGFSKGGYHFLIRKNGLVEAMRPLDEVGAHVKGMNSYSVGVCFAGHGDVSGLTPAQLESGRKLLKELMKRYGLTPASIIGHREAQERLFGRAWKTCPGSKVDVASLFRLYFVQ